MPQKSLSTTTLALRFMQNGAHKQNTEQQKVEIEQAHVKDDAEWEVSEEVRRAWGVVHGGDEDRKRVTYEQSYLPFLFPSLSDGENERVRGHEGRLHAGMKNTVSLRPRGRRTFGKHGREVAQVPDTSTASPRKLGRLKSISSFGKPQSSKKGRETTSDEGMEIEKRERDPSKTAKNVIRDISGVGTDLRAQRPSGFMKPQGVDAPVRVNVKEEDGSPSSSMSSAAVDLTVTRRKDKVKMKRAGDAVRLEGRDGPTKKKPKLEVIE
ncbi:hypothetical protein F5J12DRAFT_722794 [Pisolithus orientalis]|uniref:uncharacterized protein n=1 Tax=Pisolithus orientalis TaxID=936130 RepID=UPI002225A073|nr:uncharacterized protein F5J12DRAFT_722794 [Pisolithus orientalis]KAI6003298.1 hypothetical protein F5J12DRAFT_722794 [Pisolithus orientalis]